MRINLIIVRIQSIMEPLSKDNMSDREFEIWKIQFDKLHSGLLQAGKSVQTHSIQLILMMVLFSIITYSNVIDGTIKVPVLSIEIDKWHAALFGPVLISLFMLTFSISRALHITREVMVFKHIVILRGNFEEKLPLAYNPSQFTELILFPSVYNFIDSIERPRSIYVLNILLQLVWIIFPIILQAHLSYMILLKYSWSVPLLILYSICFAICLFSLSKIAVIDVEKVVWSNLEDE